MSENFPSLTKTWHSKPYDAISPSRAELSAKGKTVVITGGGGAIGGATALAFAGAGASKIVVIGRRAEPLEETKRKVEEAVSDCSVKVVQGDLADAVSMKNAFEKIAHEFGGKVDVLVANAGYLPSFGSIVEADPDEWFRGFEINGKGAFNLARAFLPHAADDAVIVYVSTAVVHMKGLPAASSYVASKLAADKIWEIFGVENPDLSVFHVHPGVVYSEINVKSGVVPLDDGMWMRLALSRPSTADSTQKTFLGSSSFGPQVKRQGHSRTSTCGVIGMCQSCSNGKTSSPNRRNWSSRWMDGHSLMRLQSVCRGLEYTASASASSISQ